MAVCESWQYVLTRFCAISIPYTFEFEVHEVETYFTHGEIVRIPHAFVQEKWFIFNQNLVECDRTCGCHKKILPL